MGNVIAYNGRRRVYDDPEATKLGLQFEQNAEERVFSFPRILEGFDLAEFDCFLLLSGSERVEKLRLSFEEVSAETLKSRWSVPAAVTASGKPVVFQPVFVRENVMLRLDKDIFTVGASVDIDEAIRVCYPDYVAAVEGKADRAELENYCTKEELSSFGSGENLLINPNSVIWQRGTSFTLTPGADWTYCEDRWRYRYTGPAGTTAAVAKPSSSGVKITVPEGGTLTRQQVLEEYCKGSFSQSVDGVVETGAFEGYLFTQTFEADAVIDWCKVEEGAAPTAFSPRPCSEELLLCQRYFYRAETIRCSGSSIGPGGTSIVLGIPVPVPMRTLTPRFDTDFCRAVIAAGGTLLSGSALERISDPELQGLIVTAEYDFEGLSSAANRPAAVTVTSALGVDAEIYD